MRHAAEPSLGRLLLGPSLRLRSRVGHDVADLCLPQRSGRLPDRRVQRRRRDRVLTRHCPRDRLAQRTDTTAGGYHAVCSAALAQLGTEVDLRQIGTFSLDLDLLADQAAAACWAELPPPSRHHQRLRLRRAVRLFHAAIE